MYLSEADARSASTTAKTVIADFADKNSLRRAFKDVESLFLVCSPIPRLVELESNAIEVFVDESRPLLQGSRLTAWELQRAGIRVTGLPPQAYEL